MKMTFINQYGETLHMNNDNDKIVFNHSDIHQPDEYEPIEMVSEYILNAAEQKAIMSFIEIVKMV